MNPAVTEADSGGHQTIEGLPPDFQTPASRSINSPVCDLLHTTIAL